ncbi:hypothetical protein MKZ15_06240 [Paenibacillus sp. FSL R7-0216]|uniref:hypothetical protein n=1 Tax=Paenibacillus sp. FSL R7-0216 TaxID=2921677 RepID=UPI0030D7D9B8
MHNKGDVCYISKPKLGRPFALPPTELQKWLAKYGEQNDKPRSILFVLNAIESGLIKEEDEFAAQLLYNSMESRINSCKYGQGVYDGVYCDWSNVIDACSEVIMKRPDIWLQWCEMSKVYLRDEQKLSSRPTIDRINEDPTIGYRLFNIQVLSHGDNAKKALSKPHYVFEVDLTDSFNLRTDKKYKKYSSKKEAVESLGLSFSSDKGRLYRSNGKTYLVQSEQVTLGLKEIEEYDDANEEKWYRASIPIGTLTDQNGVEYYVGLPFIFPQMKILLKDININT